MQNIENKQQLIDYFFQGSKTKDSWRIGTEHEKFLFDIKTFEKNLLNYKQDGNNKLFVAIDNWITSNVG